LLKFSIILRVSTVRVLNIRPQLDLNQWFSKWVESPLWGDIEGQRVKKPRRAIGGKTTQRGENAQPLINIEYFQ